MPLSTESPLHHLAHLFCLISTIVQKIPSQHPVLAIILTRDIFLLLLAAISPYQIE
jgi:hypothetical protein